MHHSLPIYSHLLILLGTIVLIICSIHITCIGILRTINNNMRIKKLKILFYILCRFDCIEREMLNFYHVPLAFLLRYKFIFN